MHGRVLEGKISKVPQSDADTWFLALVLEMLGGGRASEETNMCTKYVPLENLWFNEETMPKIYTNKVQNS